MTRIAKVLLGFNAISLLHLFRLQPVRFLRACSMGSAASKRAPSCEFSKIPEISLDEILGDRKPVIQLAVQKYDDGMLPSHQAMALLSVLVAESPKVVLEIGTFMGHTTRQMAENLESATIHTVDLPQDFSAEHDPGQELPKDDFHLIKRRIVGREYRDRPCAARIVQHFADTAHWDFAVEKPDFFFIDGSHTYEYCKNDTEKCLALSGRRGVFLWHDCDDTHPGVVRYIAECRKQGMDIRRISGTPIAYWKSV